ncbi:MAG: DUF1223 domain-containing protein [Alphaproteobacteria bacterium]|nr:DUF1223 domain-containing protein [Alphaproteobacteria bacterium]NNF71824.1 DUF1223 domain-containing protein [Paracoccaceae bacterium]
MQAWRATLAAAFIALAGSALAEDRLVVIELFTSQGCSSCPPADALLGELAQRDDVLPLSLHVDYWDYIGWKDIFADPAHTVRQKGYARVAGQRSIYTPQMIVGGADHVVGYKPMKLAMLIEEHRNAAAPVDVEVTRAGDEVEISTSATGRTDIGSAIIQIVRYIPSQTVDIRRGENRGRTLTYHNVVADLTEVAQWDGRGTHAVRARLSGDGSHAVLVQSANYGVILGAARVP